MRGFPHPPTSFLLLLLLSLTVGGCSGYGAPDSAKAQKAFGTQMAQRGLWNEARFRYEQAGRLDPNNAEIYNNLAVSYEALGLFDRALESYRRGLEIQPGNPVLRANYARFLDFYQGFRPLERLDEVRGPLAVGDPAPAETEDPPPELELEAVRDQGG